ncbi:MAG TPA: hypothetical protein V6C65_38935 [Allocoleopsis sp.]
MNDILRSTMIQHNQKIEERLRELVKTIPIEELCFVVNPSNTLKTKAINCFQMTAELNGEKVVISEQWLFLKRDLEPENNSSNQI